MLGSISIGYNRIHPDAASRLLLLCLGTLFAFPLLGCKDPKKVIDETKETYVVIEQVAGQVADMSASLYTNNFARAKELGGKLDNVLSTRMVSWSMQILNTEEKEGIDAAKALIAKLKATADITKNEQAALAQIEKYFQNKGTQRTGDIALKVAAFAVEKKYGRTGRKIFLKLSEKYRPPPAPASAVATNKLQAESQ